MPAPADSLVAAGLQQMKAGDLAAAIQSFEAALAADPAHLGALISLGAALQRQGRPAEAEARYRAVLAVQPGQSVALRNLAVLLDGQERYDDLLALADQTLASQPAHAEARLARGNALYGLGRLDQAVAAYRLTAEDKALRHEALTKLGMALAASGDPQAALAALDDAVALAPGDPVARLRRAILRLQLQDFAGGWDDYDARWRVETNVAQSGGVVPPALIPRLTLDPTHEDIAGRRVLLLGEQGVGDQLMFASMIPDLAAAAGSVTCVCDPRLVGLLAGSFPHVTVSGPADAQVRPSDVDRIVAMGSLGRLYRREIADFPGLPYLRPRPQIAERWAERLGPKPEGLRIGLAWRGGTSATRRNARSLSLDQLAPILALPGCDFVSLQYGDVRDELGACATPIRSFDAAEIDDFEDLSGLVGAVDLVVSVQTALVHLCGAVGAECLTLVPHFPEWRYGAGGAAMPWYRSVRLFRQPEPGAWGPVIHAVADALAARLASPDRRMS